MSTYVGFDPGGAGAFGWAVLDGDAWPLSLVGRGVADHAQGALAAALAAVGGRSIRAVGIDAPLFWVPAGDRRADQIVRRAVTQLGCPGGTVQSVNSLRGACLIQGVLAGMMCHRELGENTPITEAHPKALLWLLEKANEQRAPSVITLGDLNEYVSGQRTDDASDHERDASLAGFAAFAMESRSAGWQDLYAGEVDAVTPLKGVVAYWMPIVS